MSYLRLIWKLNRGLIISGMILIGLFQLMIIFMVTTFDTQAIMSSILGQMPENLKIFLNDSFFNMLTFNGAAAFGLNHPLVLSLLAMIAITIPVRHISREIENGNMELMLSLPFRRRSLVIKLWFSGFLILGAVILVSFLSSLVSIRIFHSLDVDVTIRLMKISFNLWLLFTLIMTYTLLIATLSKGGGTSGTLSAMITLLFYLLFFTGQLWSVLKPSLKFNIFHYYQPREIMLGKGDILTDCALLAGLTVILALFSGFAFNRRDIP